MVFSRRTFTAAATVAAFVSLLAAEGAVGASDGALIAASSTCRGSRSLDATSAERRAALLCMINYARGTVGLGKVRESRTLREVAKAKGRDVVGCSDFDHDACGKNPFAYVISSGFRFRMVGENLFYSQRPIGSARDAFVAWLRSPPHREVMFSPGFSHAGVAVFRLRRFSDTPRVALWVLVLAEKS
jgi:uncharacterized protein YkwD